MNLHISLYDQRVVLLGVNLNLSYKGIDHGQTGRADRCESTKEIRSVLSHVANG